MSKILHIAIAEDYNEGYNYNQNTFPAKHAEQGHEVHIITTTLKFNSNGTLFCKPEEYINPQGIYVHRIPISTKNIYTHLFINRSKGMKEKIEEIKPDIIFIHGMGSVDNKIIFKYKNAHPNVKIFMDCHTDYYNSGYHKSWKKRIVQNILSLHTRRNNEYVEKFWGTTPWRMNYLRDVYKVDPKKIDLLIMGGDETYIVGKDIKATRKSIREKYNIPQDAFLVITGGRLDKRKQQHILMDAIKELGKEKAWLLAFGTPTDEMKNKYDEYKNIENIVMPGWINGTDSYDLFLASDLAVFPGTHSVLWEQAVACGIPGIFQYWEGMAHIKVNENAVLLNNVNVETLKEAILSSIERYSIMKSDAEKIASQFYLGELAKKSIGQQI